MLHIILFVSSFTPFPVYAESLPVLSPTLSRLWLLRTPGNDLIAPGLVPISTCEWSDRGMIDPSIVKDRTISPWMHDVQPAMCLCCTGKLLCKPPDCAVQAWSRLVTRLLASGLDIQAFGVSNLRLLHTDYSHTPFTPPSMGESVLLPLPPCRRHGRSKFFCQ